MNTIKFTLACLILSIPALNASAEPQKIVVMGTEVLVDKIGYFAGSKTISNFTVINPVEFQFPRGNKVLARDTVYLHSNGNISLIVSPEKLDLSWKTFDGREAFLDCGARPGTIDVPRTARMITFHNNGEYRSGCAAYNGLMFKDALGNEVTVSGSLDVTPEFKLLYGQKVSEGAVKAGDSLVKLLPGSEAAFYPSGAPRFFTMILGETFSVNQPNYGKLTFRQKEGKSISTSLFENGQIDKGIIAQDLTLIDSTVKIPAGSGIIFSAETNQITDIIFTIPAAIEAQGYSILASSFSVEDSFYALVVAKEFKFKNPSNGLMIVVPAGSQVALSKNMEIIGIKIPRKEEEPVSPNDL